MKLKAESESLVVLKDVVDARQRISTKLIHTPLAHCHAVSEHAGRPVFLKLENMQKTGSFKARGALNKTLSLGNQQRRKGLVCASTGNHGLGVAYAASRAGVPCVVVLPDPPNAYKARLLEKLGARVVMYGTTSDERQEKVDELVRENDYVEIHPFADPMLIAGQGTVGLEIMEDLPEVQEVYVPIGGGGLIAGIALAIKEQRPSVRVYGVQPENANAMAEALRGHQVVTLESIKTIADGLAAGATEELNLSLVQRYVDDVILVSDRAILEATLLVIERSKLWVEPSGAASVAGLLANRRGKGRAVAVLSGGNATLQQVQQYKSQLGMA
ncbi:MAG TPA: threonine/serine dehydratase [Terriglobia bacterium]|nr:threonine/serine dehydratase [Terriglobia bacterium]